MNFIRILIGCYFIEAILATSMREYAMNQPKALSNISLQWLQKSRDKRAKNSSNRRSPNFGAYAKNPHFRRRQNSRRDFGNYHFGSELPRCALTKNPDSRFSFNCEENHPETILTTVNHKFMPW